MKKFMALLIMVLFIIVNTTGAFAAQRFAEIGRAGSGRAVFGRVEHRNDNRNVVRRHVQPGNRSFFNRPVQFDRRATISRPNRHNNNDYFRHNRPVTSHHGNYFNRGRYDNHRSYPHYRPIRPLHSYRSHHHRSNSLSPLEFFGIGAAIIAIAAAASHAHCDY